MCVIRKARKIVRDYVNSYHDGLFRVHTISRTLDKFYFNTTLRDKVFEVGHAPRGWYIKVYELQERKILWHKDQEHY